MLTPRQRIVLETLIDISKQCGYPPTVRELGDRLGLKSSSTTHNHLSNLEAMGYIRREPSKPRTITVLKAG